jgi:hypothetical protein
MAIFSGSLSRAAPVEIAAGAERPADEYDAAQERGEEEKRNGGDRVSSVSKQNRAAKITEVGTPFRARRD